jgi:DNA-directed RNA polymerase specialized sigma24 family protein
VRVPGVSRGVVSDVDIITVFVQFRARAVRVARGIAGDLFAEDVVQDVFLYLIERRDELKQVPTIGYVLKAVRHAAYGRLRLASYQRTVMVDAVDLLHIEALMYALEHGRPRTPEVTFAGLPEPVA